MEFVIMGGGKELDFYIQIDFSIFGEYGTWNSYGLFFPSDFVKKSWVDDYKSFLATGHRYLNWKLVDEEGVT